jgi:hypothetical protein
VQESKGTRLSGVQAVETTGFADFEVPHLVYPSNISSYRAPQADDCREGVGQLRTGFRHLLQCIHDGKLADARQTYRDLSRSMPGVFQKLGSKLTLDYDAIGRALAEGNIPGARRAVVKLKQDMQDIQAAGNPGPLDRMADPGRNAAPASYGTLDGYRSGDRREHRIGTRIDIVV